MLSKTAAAAPSDDALSAAATAYVSAMFNRPDASNVSVHAHYGTDGGSKVIVTGSATISTNFMSIFGIDQLNIGASTTSTWGNTRLRVALVLDNTGSMAHGGTRSNGYTSKMDALKIASHNLLTQLYNAAAGNPDNVYVSIVPFSKDLQSLCVVYCNFEQTLKATAGTWTHAAHTTWNGCVTDRDQNFCTTNDAPSAGGTLYPADNIPPARLR